jgi:hypothetical protein
MQLTTDSAEVSKGHKGFKTRKNEKDEVDYLRFVDLPMVVAGFD